MASEVKGFGRVCRRWPSTRTFCRTRLAAVSLGLAKPCCGATIALRRSMLDRIGGFGVLADVLADDHAIGVAVRSAGYDVVTAPFLVGHRCFEESLRQLVRHQIRVARTIKSIYPVAYAGTIVTHPWPLALLAMLSGSPAAVMVAVAALLARVMLCRSVRMAIRAAAAKLLAYSGARPHSFRCLCDELLRGDSSLAGRRLPRDGGRHPDRRTRDLMHLSHTEIFESVEDFYRRFYFRAPKIASIISEMVRSGCDGAAATRRPRVFFLPARTAGAGALNRLIVTADDFGLSEPVNAAIEEAHRRGILSAASLMIGGPAAADAIKRARALPNLRVGLHVVLVDGKPMLDAKEIPGLVDGSGWLRNDLAAYGAQIVLSPSLRRQVDQGNRRAVRRLPRRRIAARPRQYPPALSSSSRDCSRNRQSRKTLRHAGAARPVRALAHRCRHRSKDATSGRPYCSAVGDVAAPAHPACRTDNRGRRVRTGVVGRNDADSASPRCLAGCPAAWSKSICTRRRPTPLPVRRRVIGTPRNLLRCATARASPQRVHRATRAAVMRMLPETQFRQLLRFRFLSR